MRTRLATGRPSTSAGINFHSSVDLLRYSEASCLPETLTDRTLPAESTTKFTRTFPFKSVRDDRPAGDPAAPAVWFGYSADRKGEHPQQHLREYSGTLQADAYAGFEPLS